MYSSSMNRAEGCYVYDESGKKCMCLKNQYFSAYGCSVPDKEKDWVFVEWNDRENKSIEEYKALLSNSIDFSEIGVFLFEPGNSSGLVKLPPANLIAALQFFCKMYNILIVVDEVTTGIGRTGKWFGYMHYPIYPDIVAVKPADRVIRTYCPLTVTKDMIDSYLLALESVLKDVTK